jgi:hypothetical protein
LVDGVFREYGQMPAGSATPAEKIEEAMMLAGKFVTLTEARRHRVFKVDDCCWL